MSENNCNQQSSAEFDNLSADMAPSRTIINMAWRLVKKKNELRLRNGMLSLNNRHSTILATEEPNQTMNSSNLKECENEDSLREHEANTHQLNNLSVPVYDLDPTVYFQPTFQRKPKTKNNKTSLVQSPDVRNDNTSKASLSNQNALTTQIRTLNSEASYRTTDPTQQPKLNYTTSTSKSVPNSDHRRTETRNSAIESNSNFQQNLPSRRKKKRTVNQTTEVPSYSGRNSEFHSKPRNETFRKNNRSKNKCQPNTQQTSDTRNESRGRNTNYHKSYKNTRIRAPRRQYINCQNNKAAIPPSGPNNNRKTTETCGAAFEKKNCSKQYFNSQNKRASSSTGPNAEYKNSKFNNETSRRSYYPKKKLHGNSHTPTTTTIKKEEKNVRSILDIEPKAQESASIEGTPSVIKTEYYTSVAWRKNQNNLIIPVDGINRSSSTTLPVPENNASVDDSTIQNLSRKRKMGSPSLFNPESFPLLFNEFTPNRCSTVSTALEQTIHLENAASNEPIINVPIIQSRNVNNPNFTYHVTLDHIQNRNNIDPPRNSTQVPKVPLNMASTIPALTNYNNHIPVLSNVLNINSTSLPSIPNAEIIEKNSNQYSVDRNFTNDFPLPNNQIPIMHPSETSTNDYRWYKDPTGALVFTGHINQMYLPWSTQDMSEQKEIHNLQNLHLNNNIHHNYNQMYQNSSNQFPLDQISMITNQLNAFQISESFDPNQNVPNIQINPNNNIPFVSNNLQNLNYNPFFQKPIASQNHGYPFNETFGPNNYVPNSQMNQSLNFNSQSIDDNFQNLNYNPSFHNLANHIPVTQCSTAVNQFTEVHNPNNQIEFNAQLYPNSNFNMQSITNNMQIPNNLSLQYPINPTSVAENSTSSNFMPNVQIDPNFYIEPISNSSNFNPWLQSSINQIPFPQNSTNHLNEYQNFDEQNGSNQITPNIQIHPTLNFNTQYVGNNLQNEYYFQPFPNMTNQISTPENSATIQLTGNQIFGTSAPIQYASNTQTYFNPYYNFGAVTNLEKNHNKQPATNPTTPAYSHCLEEQGNVFFLRSEENSISLNEPENSFSLNGRDNSSFLEGQRNLSSSIKQESTFSTKESENLETIQNQAKHGQISVSRQNNVSVFTPQTDISEVELEACANCPENMNNPEAIKDLIPEFIQGSEKHLSRDNQCPHCKFNSEPPKCYLSEIPYIEKLHKSPIRKAKLKQILPRNATWITDEIIIKNINLQKSTNEVLDFQLNPNNERILSTETYFLTNHVDPYLRAHLNLKFKPYDDIDFILCDMWKTFSVSDHLINKKK